MEKHHPQQKQLRYNSFLVVYISLLTVRGGNRVTSFCLEVVAQFLLTVLLVTRPGLTPDGS